MNGRFSCSIIAALTLTIGLSLTSRAGADLVGYWKFNDDVQDYSGTGNDGTSTNLDYNTDVPDTIGYGKSGDFDNTAYVTIAADESLNSSAFTLTYWLNQNGVAQGGNYDRVTSRASDNFETAVSSTDRLHYYGKSSGWTNTGHDVPDNEWQHIAFVSDGTNMNMYSDGANVYSGAAPGIISGFMRIGGRHNATQFYQGLIDDVALWDEALGPSRIARLADGDSFPIDEVTVGSDPDTWLRSTVRKTGGALGDWVLSDPLPADWIPDVSTFTETPTQAGSTIGGVAAQWDVKGITADGGAGQPEGVQFFRTTFELDPWPGLLAEIKLSVDNGAQVFINGVEVAREISYLAENWNPPYSTLTINPDGSISDVTLFDQTAASFSNWLVGENELIVVTRNPDSEGIPGGGFAFRMDLYNVPEPTTLGLAALAALCLLGYRRRKGG